MNVLYLSLNVGDFGFLDSITFKVQLRDSVWLPEGTLSRVALEEARLRIGEAKGCLKTFRHLRLLQVLQLVEVIILELLRKDLVRLKLLLFFKLVFGAVKLRQEDAQFLDE